MGLDNAYAINPATERPWGVERCPGRMPGLFAQGVTALSLSQVQINRPRRDGLHNLLSNVLNLGSAPAARLI